MERLVSYLKMKNRTILEMYTGVLGMALIAQIVGLFVARDFGRYSVGLWLGIVLALISIIHMYQTLDRGLGRDEKTATRVIFMGYLTRYFVLVAVLMLVGYTGIVNPIVVFAAYMTLKVTALIQPFTHKFYNYIFHETDPVAEAIPDEEPEIVEASPAGASTLESETEGTS